MMKIPRRAFGLTIAGVGLILFGAVFLFKMADKRMADAVQPTDFSAVPAAVRYNAPALTLKDLNGTTHTLSDYRGQVALVNLWATWCPPCKAEMPNLQRFYERHRNEGFSVIAIEDGDPAADVVSFVHEYGLTFPVWLDPTYQATDHAFKTMNLPSSYVIDRAGTVRLAWFGAISEANLERYITPLIGE